VVLTTKIIKDVVYNIPSIKKIILIPYEFNEKDYQLDFEYDNLCKILQQEIAYSKFEKFNFNHPLYILYSSGTTGVPKCIVHSSGGALIQHKKEHVLHCDINEKDSEIYKLKNDDRAYHLLDAVGTKPNVVYQVKVRNTKNKV